MLQIRPARGEDRDEVMRLWEGAGLDAASDEEWRSITAGGCARLLVGEDDGVVVGSAVAAYDGWRAFISHVAVTTEHRRRGIATALVAGAEDDLRSRGAQRVFALVHESETDGLALSAATGYEIEGDLAFVKTLSR